MRNLLNLLVVGSALAALSGPAAAMGLPVVPQNLTTCQLPNIPRPARCGTIILPENWQQPAGRKIAIRVAVVPALHSRSRSDPVAVLLGGPGESAVEDASVYVDWLAPILQDRDLLLVDQRGAGGSAPLTCKLADHGDPIPLFRDTFPPMAVRRCVDKLAKVADLTRYGYTDFANDLEAVRRRLGYSKLNLFGGSYGTRAEQVFLRRYPGSVRTVYLGSVVPMDIATPPTMARTAQIALDHLYADCAADVKCGRAYPTLREDFAKVLRRLQGGEARVRLPGGAETVLHHAPAVAWLRSKLYRPASAAVLPWVINRASRGDWTPIADGIVAGIDTTFSLGLFFAITCNEDVRFINRSTIKSLSKGTFLGDSRVQQQIVACGP